MALPSPGCSASATGEQGCTALPSNKTLNLVDAFPKDRTYVTYSCARRSALAPRRPDEIFLVFLARLGNAASWLDSPRRLPCIPYARPRMLPCLKFAAQQGKPDHAAVHGGRHMDQLPDAA